MTAQASLSVLLFVRLEYTGSEDVKVHTGVGSKFYADNPWSRYHGLGSLLSVGVIEDSTGTSATTYNVTLTLPDKDDARYRERRVDLLQAAANGDFVGKDVAIYQWAEGLTPEPQLWLLAKVESVSTSTNGVISMDLYTSAAQLDRVYYNPTLYNDVQQVKLRDPKDRAFRFATTELSEAGLEFP